VEKKITFVIGGCRSGKSSFALDQANLIPVDKAKGEIKIFIATSVPRDSEMEHRVKKHQHERGSDWHTIEEPVKIHEIINKYSDSASVILVDCMTLWISNLLLNSCDEAQLDKAIKRLKDSLASCKCPVFLVSNEVGTGIVPENKLARQFRDFAGFANQKIAKAADRVVMTIAGIDVQIKPA